MWRASPPDYLCCSPKSTLEQQLIQVGVRVRAGCTTNKEWGGEGDEVGPRPHRNEMA
jgi:hypothetical protein